MIDASYQDPMFSRQVIIENYRHPGQMGMRKDDETMIRHQASESCIDDLYVELKLQDDKIVDARFDGVGCAVSTASTNIMAKQLVGKTRQQGLRMIDDFLAMIHEEPYEDELLDELGAFVNVSKQANRIKCAVIGIKGYRSLLSELGNGKKNGSE